jgi:hypothetical protein
MEKELRETKDLLMMMMMKYEKFALETNTKIDNFTNILHEQSISSKEKEEVIMEEEIHAEIYAEDDLSETESEREFISPVNLKEVIESELANEI